MSLTQSQKRFIQDHYHDMSPGEMAKELGSSKKSILKHIQKNKSALENQSVEEHGTKIQVKEHYAYLGLLGFFVLIVYANAIGAAFVSDDIYVLVNEEHTFRSWEYFLIQPTVFIRNLLYFSAYHIGGLSPFLFRLPNILFHIGFVWMVYLIMPFFSKKKYLPFIVALFAAVHPMMVESVTWISGGIYAQSGFFLLLTLYLYLRARQENKNILYYYSLIAYVAAISSSEKVIIFPFIVLLYEFTFGNLKKVWLKIGSFFTISFLWGLMLLTRVSERLDYLQTTNGATQRIDWQNPLVQIPVALSSYFQLYLWPRHLTLYQSEFAMTRPEFVIRAGAALLFFGIAAWNYKKNKAVFFWLMFFFISLWPTMNPFGLSWVVAERYSYLGSIGLYFGFTVLIYKYFIDKKPYQMLGYTMIGILLVALSVRTVVRNIDWKNEDNLWVATAKASPSDPKTHNNLGDVYARNGDLPNAAKAFENAIKLNPRYPDAHHNLANIYMEQGKTEEAIRLYNRAIELNPALWQSHQNLGALYYRQGDYEKALEENMTVIKMNPYQANAYLNIGVIYYQLGDKINAKKYFRKVLELDPNNQMAQQGMIETSK